MQLLDEVATIREVAKSLECSVSKAVIESKINELQQILEILLSTELE